MNTQTFNGLLVSSSSVLLADIFTSSFATKMTKLPHSFVHQCADLMHITLWMEVQVFISVSCAASDTLLLHQVVLWNSAEVRSLAVVLKLMQSASVAPATTLWHLLLWITMLASASRRRRGWLGGESSLWSSREGRGSGRKGPILSHCVLVLRRWNALYRHPPFRF